MGFYQGYAKFHAKTTQSQKLFRYIYNEAFSLPLLPFGTYWWARWDLNPQDFWSTDFKSVAYTNSATRPVTVIIHIVCKTILI